MHPPKLASTEGRTSERPSSRRPTFCQILEGSRRRCAESAWERAVRASELRHAIADGGRGREQLSQIKSIALRRVVELVPEHVTVTLDDTFQIGLVSVIWPGHGSLHLPADTDLSSSPSVHSLARVRQLAGRRVIPPKAS